MGIPFAELASALAEILCTPLPSFLFACRLDYTFGVVSGVSL